MRNPKYWAELLATFCLVFTGTGAIVVNQVSGGQLTHLGICLVFGLAVTAMIYTVGHRSGAHMNPAVTLGFYCAGRHPAKEVAPYLAAQFAGAVLASGALKLIFAGQAVGALGATLPSGSWVSSLGLEFIITFILMFVVMGVATGDREEGLLAGIAIGGTVALLALVAGPISGCSMNPARSFGPALLSGTWTHQWIYWAGPAAGSVCGVKMHQFLQVRPDLETF
jgi:aquaporin Z